MSDRAALLKGIRVWLDPGQDSAPVPQYLTRASPADASTVPQRSRV